MGSYFIGLHAGALGSWAHFSAARSSVLGISLSLLAFDPAVACRNYYGWSTGDDLGKLKPNEVVVKAKLIESYKSDQLFKHNIMGIGFGRIYHVEIVEVIGGAVDTGSDVRLRNAERIFVRLRPQVCEQYFPYDFAENAERIFVLKKGDSGLYDLVGGQDK